MPGLLFPLQPQNLKGINEKSVRTDSSVFGSGIVPEGQTEFYKDIKSDTWEHGRILQCLKDVEEISCHSLSALPWLN